jgi:hypothetical protein
MLRPISQGRPGRRIGRTTTRGAVLQNVFHLIDLRSFSNIWYWIILAGMWSSLSHFVLGVPYDMVTRARRHGGAAEADLEAMVRVQVRRRTHLVEQAGAWMVALAAAALTLLAVLGFGYGSQLGQAAFLLLFPAALVGIIDIRAAWRLQASQPQGAALCSALSRERRKVQALGTLSILVTAFWGMWQVATVSVLGG